jgi:broad specificity phosphatase PhoE
MNFTKLNFVPDKMNVHFDMLCPAVLNWIGGQINNRNIVTVYHSGPVNGLLEFLQDLANPARLGNNMGNITVLCFNA